MSKVLFILFLLPLAGYAHPGVGIVKDSKGNIYYTDLKQVWKISKGKKTVIVPNVHTHELYVDVNDNLYGEGGYYDGRTKKFYHYLWVHQSDRRIDTVIGMSEQYHKQDFSLARDKKGNEFYLKRFLVPHTDTNHIYKKTVEGEEFIYARGAFTNVNWLHPQGDGTLLYVSNNSIYRVDTSGLIKVIKEHVGNAIPSFKFSGNNITIWGVWQDNAKNIYAAVSSDQTVKRIDAAGEMTEIYKSKGNWAPLHGVVDNEDKLWILEGSDNNEVRVTLVDTLPTTILKTKSNMPAFSIARFIVLGIIGIYSLIKKIN